MTKIEWSDHVWNPLAGCSIISPACDNCYAMRMAFRLDHMGQEKYRGTTRKTESGRIIWTGKINFDEEALMAPLKWREPKRVFVNSMSDLFHENVPFEWIDKVFAIMALTPHVTYQVLTKRPYRMYEYFNHPFIPAKDGWKIQAAELPVSQYNKKDIWEYIPQTLPNVWLGTTVESESQEHRIAFLRKCPAAVRFISYEPALGPINWANDLFGHRCLTDNNEPGLTGKIHWVIAGGESGPGARPSHPDWFRSLRDQCQAAGVPFFFKQWGEWAPGEDVEANKTDWPGMWELHRQDGGAPRFYFKDSPFRKGDFATCLPGEIGGDTFVLKVGKKAAGRLLDGVEWSQFPETGKP